MRMIECRYKTKIKDIQDKYKFKIFCYDATGTSIADFNANAAQKTQEFNQNAVDKTNDFDEHASSIQAELDEVQDQLEKAQQDLSMYKMLENAIPKVTDEDETIILDKTAQYPLKYTLKGNTSQFSTTGKNIAQHIEGYLSSGTFKSSGDDSFYFPVTQGETYIYQSTGNRTKCAIFDDIPTNNKNCISGTSGDISKGTPFVASATGYMCIYAQTPTTQSVIDTFMAVKGSTLGDYEPYTGGDPSPNPDYPQDIHIVSGDNTITIANKNLFVESWSSGSINGSGSNISDSTSIRTARNPIDASTQYTFSSDTTTSITQFWVYYYNGDTFISRESLGTGNTQTFTTPSGVNSVRFRLSASNDISTSIISNVQLEKATQKTSYVQHREQTQLISLGDIELNKISTYQDYIYKENDKWYLHKEIGKVVLDGSETFEIFNTTSARTAIMTSSINNLETYSSSSNIPKLYCNYFMAMSENDTWKPNYVSRRTTTTRLYFLLSSGTTVEQFKTWLSTHNTIVYYVLDTPTDTEIIDTILIGQLETILYSYQGQTNISQVNNDKPFIINASALYDLSDLVNRVAALETE